MRIAVDAMGGDHGPSVTVPGALLARGQLGIDLTLVGDPAQIEPLLTTGKGSSGVEIIEATQEIGMGEHPAQAVRRKPNSSIMLALAEVKAGRAQGMVSAGNSGAVMAGALLTLGRIKGVDRPAIGSYIPSARQGTLVLDLGAVTDPRPIHLVQWAIMGKIYAQKILGRPDPVVGLLSNGEEPSKGNLFVQEVYPLLDAEKRIQFHGNVEGRDVPLGVVDIVVTDGFTGNVALKVAEGTASYVGEIIRAEITSTLPRKLAALVLRPAFRAVRTKMDYASIGGAPLLGVDGTAIIAHGRSSSTAIQNAIGAAVASVNADLPLAIRQAFETPPTTS